jgi:hypothetical protein
MSWWGRWHACLGTVRRVEDGSQPAKPVLSLQHNGRHKLPPCRHGHICSVFLWKIQTTTPSVPWDRCHNPSEPNAGARLRSTHHYTALLQLHTSSSGSLYHPRPWFFHWRFLSVRTLQFCEPRIELNSWIQTPCTPSSVSGLQEPCWLLRLAMLLESGHRSTLDIPRQSWFLLFRELSAPI